MECNSDDVGGDFSTALTLPMDRWFTSDFNLACGDVDMFRLKVEAGRQYRVRWSTQAGGEFDLLDHRGWSHWAYGLNRFISDNIFLARHDEDYFFRASKDRGIDEAYAVLFEEVNGTGALDRGIATKQRFEEDNLKQVFIFEVRTGERYALEIIAEEGVDPWIGTRTGGKNLYSAGSGNRARIEFTAAGGQGSGYYATVGAANPGEYTLKLSSIGDDHSVGPSTESRIEPGKPIVGNVETGDDVDWFRASLKAGEFYRVQLDRHDRNDSLGTPLLIVRDPESIVIDSSFVVPPLGYTDDSGFLRGTAGPELVVQADSTGDHFFIARSKVSDVSGFYHLKYEWVRAPITRKYQSSEFEEESLNQFELTDNSPIPLTDFFAAPEASTEYQIFSQSIEFLKDSVPQPAGVIHSIDPADINQWSLQSVEFGNDEIMIRAQTGGKWSEWLKTNIVSRSPNPDLLSGSSWPDERFNYHFSQTLPTYFEGVYEGFQSLRKTDGNETSGLRHYLDRNPWNFSNTFPNDSNDENSPIQVFIADNVEGYYDVFAPGDDAGGDIILNSEFFSVDSEPIYGSRESVELIRALGEAMGLKLNPNLSQAESVMGNLELGRYATRFMPQDLDALLSLYESRNRFQISYEDLGGGPPNFTSISYVPGQNDGFGTSSFPQSRRIDLRTGGQNYIREIPENERYTYVSGDGYTISGRGGLGDDLIFGNGADNFLSGSLGNDYLQGFSGDDVLRGGNGNDWYGYQFGGGNDRITEAKSTSAGNWPGRDTIRLQGFGPFDLGNLEDSVEFHRLGTDLRIYLSLDQGAPDGQILVRDQAYGSFSVETIELFHDGARSSPRISLKSIFSQLSDGEIKRFRMTESEDQFGRLVTPV